MRVGRNKCRKMATGREEIQSTRGTKATNKGILHSRDKGIEERDGTGRQKGEQKGLPK